MLQSARGPQTLLSTSALTGAVAVVGSTYRLRPAPGDGLNDDAQVFSFISTLQSNGGASSPTAQTVVEGSVDNVTFFTIASVTALASDDSVKQEQMAETANQRVPPFIRAKTVVAGGTAPTKVVASVKVTSNGDFSLEAV